MAASGAGSSTPRKPMGEDSGDGTPSKAGIGDRIAVTCRFRPLNKKELKLSAKTCVYMPKGNHQQVVLNTLDKAQYKFNFDRVFPSESTQLDVYASSAKPVVDAVFQGYNGCVLAYGQTGAGKSHTMSGPDTSDSDMQGVIPRVAQDVFTHAMEADESIEFSVECSFVEIYLEKIRDLLDSSKTNLPVREDPKLGVYVQDATTVSVISAEEMLMVMQQGDSNRAVAATGMNEGSSRSHSLFSINITQTNTESGEVKRSRLVLVDLAGSEMAKKTGVTGKQMEEAQNINRSLSALGNVINALTDGRSSHIPYRDSKLTRVLQESIGGNSRTSLIICCSPSSYNEMESLSTLRFGKRAKSIKNKAKVNRERSPEEMKRIIAKLEAEAASRAPMLSSLLDREGRWVGAVTGGLDVPALKKADVDTIDLKLDEPATRDLLRSVGKLEESGGEDEEEEDAEKASDAAEAEVKAAIGKAGGGSSSAAPADESTAAVGSGGGSAAAGEGKADAAAADPSSTGGGAASAASDAVGRSVSEEEVAKLKEDMGAYKAKSQSLTKHVKMMTDLLKEASKEIKETRKKLEESQAESSKFKEQADEREKLIEKLEQMRLQEREDRERLAKEAREAAEKLAAEAEAKEKLQKEKQQKGAEGEDADGASGSDEVDRKESGRQAIAAAAAEAAAHAAAAADAQAAMQQAKEQAESAAKSAAETKAQLQELEQEMDVLRETYRNAKQSNEDLRSELEQAQAQISRLTEEKRKQEEEAAEAEAARKAAADAAASVAAAGNSAPGTAGSSGSSTAQSSRPSSPNLSTEAAGAMVKSRHKVAMWEKQRMGPDGKWVSDLAPGDGHPWEQAAGSGDDKDALAAESPGSAMERDDVELPDGWHWLCEWIVEKGSERRNKTVQATSLDDQEVEPSSPGVRRTDKHGWEFAPSFDSMRSGVASTVEPEPARLATPEKARGGANAVRRRKWIRVRVQIELPDDQHESARQVLHLARTVDAQKAALRSITDELQQVTALNSQYENRIFELTNKMAQAVMSGDMSLIGGSKRGLQKKRTIRGGGGMRRAAALRTGQAGGPSTPGGSHKPQQSGGLFGFLSMLGRGFQSEAPKPAPAEPKNRANVQLCKDAEKGRVGAVQQFLESLPSDDARKQAMLVRDKMGRTPLHYAARGGSLSSVQVLVEAGAELTAGDSDGRNCLHYAARRGSMDVAAWLIQQGVSPNRTDSHLLTALHQAALGMRAPMCDLLLHRGADAYALDAAGRTSLDLAERFKDKSAESLATIRLIQQWEASHPKTAKQAERAAAFSTPEKSDSARRDGPAQTAASKMAADGSTKPAASSPLARTSSRSAMGGQS